MRKIFFWGLMLFSFSLFSQNVTLKVTGIKEAKGNILIGIFNSPENFTKVGSEIKRISVPANAKTVKVVVSDLKEGYYAFTVLHDKNANGQCDYNMLGIPKESFGFSNNVKPKLKAPSFEAVKVNVAEDTTMTINLLTF